MTCVGLSVISPLPVSLVLSSAQKIGSSFGDHTNEDTKPMTEPALPLTKNWTGCGRNDHVLFEFITPEYVCID
jgi:hypothetical protein